MRVSFHTLADILEIATLSALVGALLYRLVRHLQWRAQQQREADWFDYTYHV